MSKSTASFFFRIRAFIFYRDSIWNGIAFYLRYLLVFLFKLLSLLNKLGNGFLIFKGFSPQLIVKDIPKLIDLRASFAGDFNVLIPCSFDFFESLIVNWLCLNSFTVLNVSFVAYDNDLDIISAVNKSLFNPVRKPVVNISLGNVVNDDNNIGV